MSLRGGTQNLREIALGAIHEGGGSSPAARVHRLTMRQCRAHVERERGSSVTRQERGFVRMVLEAETAALLTGRRKGSIVEGTTFADAPRRPPSPPPPAAPEPDYPQSQYAHTEVAVPDIVCYDCGSGEDSASNPILLCDGSFPGGADCPQAFHLFCLEPVIALSDVPAGQWLCPSCRAEEQRGLWRGNCGDTQSPKERTSAGSRVGPCFQAMLPPLRAATATGGGSPPPSLAPVEGEASCGASGGGSAVEAQANEHAVLEVEPPTHSTGRPGSVSTAVRRPASRLRKNRHPYGRRVLYGETDGRV